MSGTGNPTQQPKVPLCVACGRVLLTFLCQEHNAEMEHVCTDPADPGLIARCPFEHGGPTG